MNIFNLIVLVFLLLWEPFVTGVGLLRINTDTTAQLNYHLIACIFNDEEAACSKIHYRCPTQSQNKVISTPREQGVFLSLRCSFGPYWEI